MTEDYKSYTDEGLEKAWQDCTNAIHDLLQSYYKSGDDSHRMGAIAQQGKQTLIQLEVSRRAK